MNKTKDNIAEFVKICNLNDKQSKLLVRLCGIAFHEGMIKAIELARKAK